MKFRLRSFAPILAVAVLIGCDSDPVEPPPDEGHTFVYVPHANTEPVTNIWIRGGFNDWSGTDWAMTQQGDGSWALTSELDPGEYQYKYVFNDPDTGWADHMCASDRWGNPPGGPIVPGLTQADCVDDGFGGANAVLVID
jgi:cyclomaltodextrinase / maltogenic alpha-amylase / neopullulanase